MEMEVIAVLPSQLFHQFHKQWMKWTGREESGQLVNAMTLLGLSKQLTQNNCFAKNHDLSQSVGNIGVNNKYALMLKY